jgi:peptide/nickel transport system substrate-binding protein
MSKLARTIAIVATSLTALGMVGGPARGQSPSASSGELTFTYGDDNDLDSLNPFVAVESPAFVIFYNTYDLLVGVDQKTLGPAPALAQSWEQSADGLTWTFHLVDGATWQDGVPLTAHDVQYTYQRILDEEAGSYIDYVSLIDSMNVPDDTTIEITTKQPTLQLLSALVFILPEHIWKDVSADQEATFENNPPVGSGPFKVVDWQKGQFVRMEANKDYWGGAPVIDQLVYRVFNNEDALVQALKSGEIDFADTLNPNPYNSLKGIEGITTHAGTIPSFDELGFNTGADATSPDSDGHPALKDVRVRQAIAYAIDKETIVDRILQGYGTLGTTIVPPVSEAYHYEPTADEVFGFDIDQANQILDDAGYLDTDGDGVREMPGGGQPLHFRYFVRSENNSTVQTAQFVQEWLNQIGISTDVEAKDDSTLTDLLYEGTYDMFEWGWYPDPDPDFILSVLTCGQRPPDGIWSDSFFCDQQYDDMYQEQKTIADLDQRATVIKEMQRIAYDQVPYIVLYYDQTLQAFNSAKWDPASFRPQPDPDGDLLTAYGNLTFLNVSPAQPSPSPTSTGTEASGDDGEGGSSFNWLLVGFIAGPIALVVIGFLLFRRRPSEDRE